MCRSGVGGRPRVVHHVVGQHNVLGRHLARPAVVAPGARSPLAGARVLLGVGTRGRVGGVLGQVLGQRRLSSHGVNDGLWWSGSGGRRWVGHVWGSAAATGVLGCGRLCGLGDGAGGVRRVWLVGR